MRRSTGREPGGVLRFVLVQLYSNMYSTAVCTLYSVHGIQLPQMYNLYSVQCTLYTVQMYTVCTVYRCTICIDAQLEVVHFTHSTDSGKLPVPIC